MILNPNEISQNSLELPTESHNFQKYRPFDLLIELQPHSLPRWISITRENVRNLSQRQTTVKRVTEKFGWNWIWVTSKMSHFFVANRSIPRAIRVLEERDGSTDRWIGKSARKCGGTTLEIHSVDKMATRNANRASRIAKSPARIARPRGLMVFTRFINRVSRRALYETDPVHLTRRTHKDA